MTLPEHTHLPSTPVDVGQLQPPFGLPANLKKVKHFSGLAVCRICKAPFTLYVIVEPRREPIAA